MAGACGILSGFIMSAAWHMRALHHSFITIWPVTAVFFAWDFAVRYAQNKGILILPMWINVLAAAGLLILISSFCLVQALITVQMKQKPEPDCEYLLILGCRVRGLEITKSLRYRLDAALAYLEQNEKHSKDNTQNKTIRIIVSGRSGTGRGYIRSTGDERLSVRTWHRSFTDFYGSSVHGYGKKHCLFGTFYSGKKCENRGGFQ